MKVSVVLPAYNEAEFIEHSIETAYKARNVYEVVVIDGNSSDGTPERARKAGAKVFRQSVLKYPGKGIAMRDGFYASRGDIIVYLDADIKNLEPEMIEWLYEPILRGEADFVKGSFKRKAGRVTELVAKPLLRVFYPELAKFEQPLSGEIAGHRRVFEAVEWVDGWGVDIALLIDIYEKGFRIVERNIGFKDHDMKPLRLLTEMAYEVAKTIIDRAIRDGRIFGVDEVYAMRMYRKAVEAVAEKEKELAEDTLLY